MAKIRVIDLTREVGMENDKLLLKLKRMGVKVKDKKTVEPEIVVSTSDKTSIESDSEKEIVEKRIKPAVIRRRTRTEESKVWALPSPQATFESKLLEEKIEPKVKVRKQVKTMNLKMKNDILFSYYRFKERYERLGHEITRLFERDPDFPKNSVYTIKHRLKGEERLIEKIESENKKQKTGSLIHSKNYQDKIEDILGMRIVCLRRSDVEKIGKYLDSLKKERKLRFVRKPERKQPPFLWIQNPKEKFPKGKDLQYSGYSSIHYVIKLAKNLNLPKELLPLRCEIQVRTILEESWGEIDHKYRYEITRKGVDIPPAIDRGFRAFSAYLQAAAVQAEYLCKDAEAFISKGRAPKPPKSTKPTIVRPPTAVSKSTLPEPETISSVVRDNVGFVPTERTLAYIERRMHESGFSQDLPKVLNENILTDEAMEIFKQIYMDIMGKRPFLDTSDRDIDLLNILNYSLFRLVQPDYVAQENLTSVLKGRIRKE